jgi:hypothetical protein
LEIDIMAQQSCSVVSMYDSLDKAEAAVRSLGQNKFPIRQVTLIAKGLQSEKQVHGYVTACVLSRQGATTGAWVGGLFGVLTGAAFLWVPGLGPLIVAGSLTSTLLGGIEGALAGAAAGGIFRGLAAWGISRHHILKYQEVVKAGNYLVVAHGTLDEVGLAYRVLEASGAAEIDRHRQAA